MTEPAPVALLVEDNDRNRKLATAVLEMAGFDVRTATTGQGALDAIATEPPDVVLLDIQLPDIDGVEVLDRLRASAATAGLCVVAVTAFAMDGDRTRLIDAGFDGYVTKPIDVATFAATIRDYLTDDGRSS